MNWNAGLKRQHRRQKIEASLLQEKEKNDIFYYMLPGCGKREGEDVCLPSRTIRRKEENRWQ